MRYILNIILAISFVLAQDAAEIKKQIQGIGPIRNPDSSDGQAAGYV